MGVGGDAIAVLPSMIYPKQPFSDGLGGVIFVVFGINFAFRCPVGGATGHLVSIL